MSDRLRFGAPPDADAASLVWRLDQPPWSDRIELTLAAPLELVRCMEAHELDAALLPVLALAARSSDWQIVPGLAVGSPGPSAMARLDHRVQLADVRTIASLAPGHTAEALVQVLFAESGRPVRIASWSGTAEHALESHDAVLVAGDAAIASAAPAGAASLDLADAWSSLTQAPMIWSVCAAWPRAVSRKMYALLHTVRIRAKRELPALVAKCAARSGAPAAMVRTVIESQTSHRLGRRELESLTAFISAVVRHGLISSRPALKFLPLAEGNLCRRVARELGIGS